MYVCIYRLMIKTIIFTVCTTRMNLSVRYSLLNFFFATCFACFVQEYLIYDYKSVFSQNAVVIIQKKKREIQLQVVCSGKSALVRILSAQAAASLRPFSTSV